jgi:acetyl-CoA synthetase
LPGVRPIIVDGVAELHGPCEGNLCLADAWPGMMRTVRRSRALRADVFLHLQGPLRATARGACRWLLITGRVDDVINVSGHRMGTAEVESALVAHPKVAELLW